ncbi:hypothetical protein AB0I28_29390 [Phytomonospora sp. NPDC050363]|uniref:hypothetical protein n=1 Tax=Phytomonospora sp. NPDC050363 TaxID=3155642 RepID=UPI0033E9A29A
MARTRKGASAGAGIVAKGAKKGMGNPAKKVGKGIPRKRVPKQSGPGKPDFRDSKGRLRDGKTGKPKHDPNAPSRHSRSSEYPHGYSDKTHGEMAQKWSKEGRDPAHSKDTDGWPLDSSGNKIPRDDLTWYDKRGRKVQPPVTYDHDPAVVEHWNDKGYKIPRTERAAYYDNPNVMEPMNGPVNSAKGAKMQAQGHTFRQDTTGRYD